MNRSNPFPGRICIFVFLLALPLLFPLGVEGASLSGLITDDKGAPLPFASIYLQNTTLGATSNESGLYFLKLDPGEYTVVVKYIGYKRVVEKVTVSGDTQKNFSLQPEDIEMEEVVITPDGKDPAYAIMRKAINRKEQNKIPYTAFSYQVYDKTVFRSSMEKDSASDAPLLKNIAGFEEPDSSEYSKDPEILYLAENISKVWEKKPNKQKEEVISSQISGEEGQYGLVGNMIRQTMDFTPYRNLIPLEGLSARGIVSPLSNSAMLFYDFKLLGTVTQNEKKAYKIEVLPKRPTDPVFTGVIYILDELYAVQELDLYLTRNNQIILMDTLRIRQDFVPLGDSVWAPFGLNFNFRMDLALFGFKFGVNGTSEAITSNYTPLPDLENSFFNREIISIADSAVERDSAYWEKERPVPLQDEEARNYFKQDSIAKAHSTPEYLDSLTRTRNEFKPIRFLTSGYTYRDYRKKITWELKAPLQTLGFNTMEGYRVGTELSRRKSWENGKWLRLNAGVRYGFSNKKLSWKAGLSTRLSRRHRDRLAFSVGDYPREFSPMQQISPFWNMGYSLVDKRNFLKMYQAKFASLSYRRRLFNGVNINLDANWQERSTLQNTTDYTWSKSDRVYSDNLEIPFHHAITVGAKVTIRPGNKFIRTPDGPRDLGSKWPTLTLA